jgi:hypothetical protein
LRTSLDHVRRFLTVVSTVGTVVVLAVSLVPRVGDLLGAVHNEHERWAKVSDRDRGQAFVTSIPLRVDIFDFYRAFLKPGDRYYIQIPPGAFSTFADKPGIVRTAGRLYLAPAVEVTEPDQADVILSWDSDPGTLPFRYSEQHRAGLQLIFVSRIHRAR